MSPVSNDCCATVSLTYATIDAICSSDKNLNEGSGGAPVLMMFLICSFLYFFTRPVRSGPRPVPFLLAPWQLMQYVLNNISGLSWLAARIFFRSVSFRIMGMSVALTNSLLVSGLTEAPPQFDPPCAVGSISSPSMDGGSYTPVL